MKRPALLLKQCCAASQEEHEDQDEQPIRPSSWPEKESQRQEEKRNCLSGCCICCEHCRIPLLKLLVWFGPLVS